MRAEKELQSQDLNEHLRFVEQRIRTHLKHRELDAALILSRDMIGLAEGNQTHATALEHLPREKSVKHINKKDLAAAIGVLVSGCSFCLALVFHYAISTTAFNCLYDRGLFPQARVAAQAEVFVESLLNERASDVTSAVASTYVAEGHVATARSFLASALAQDATNGDSYALLGRLEWYGGNLPLAEQLYKRAIEYRTSNWNKLVCNLAEVQFLQGKTADATCTIGLVNDKEPLTDFHSAKKQLIQGDVHKSCESFKLAFKNCTFAKDFYDQDLKVRSLEFYAIALRMDGQEKESETIAAEARALREKIADSLK